MDQGSTNKSQNYEHVINIEEKDYEIGTTQKLKHHYERLQCFSAVPWVLFLFAFGYVSFLYEVIYKWSDFENPSRIIHFCVLHGLISLLFYNYLKSVLISPGIVPPDWKPMFQLPELSVLDKQSNTDNTEKSENGIDENTNEEHIEQVSYCRKCDSLRPPRSHHCSDCGKCVLKYDHHCPWINNCVGYYNHKYFMLFLIYLIISGVYMLFYFLWRLIDGIFSADMFKITSASFTNFDLMLIITQLLIILSTVVTVSCLFGYQLFLILENTTNIENRDLTRSRRKNKSKMSFYDMGTLGNLKEVFGPHPIYWLWPSMPEGDGFSFRIPKQ